MSSPPSLPSRYPVAAGLLAGLAACWSVVVGYLVPLLGPDAGAVDPLTYGAATSWVGFLLVPLAPAAVGYAGGHAAAGCLDLPRAGATCLGVGLVAGVVGVGTGLVGQPGSISTAHLGLQLASFGLRAVRPASVAAAAFVACLAVAAERRDGRA